MNYIDIAFKFLQDKTKHIALRVSVPFIIIIAAIVLNDIYGVSRNFLLNRKLEQLIELKKVQPDILNDKLYLKNYTEIKREILLDSSFIISTWKNTHFFGSKSASVIKTPPTSKPSISDFKRTLWFDISTMGLAYLSSLIMFGVSISSLFISKTFKERWNVISASIFIILILLGLGRIYRELIEATIPIYENNIWLNYSLNIGIQLFVVFIIIKIVRKSSLKAK
jgi:hypothetical protein